MSTFTYSLAKFIPFQDQIECERVRKIKKEEITNHPNPEFKIRVVEEKNEFYLAMALDLIQRIVEARENHRSLVLILPVGPVPQYSIAARMINQLRIPLDHLHTFNMDEYADQDGNTAPPTWTGSFQKAMWDNFFQLIDPQLRPPEKNIHFPTKEALPDYEKMIDDLGGADCCFGGVGWCGHIAFWEAHLGFEFGDDLDAFKKAGPRLVELHPMTIMQNALHSFSGDWSWVPPCANTIGPAQIVGAKDRSFWLDGCWEGGVSWQKFIARLAAHGRVNPLVPASILQTVPGTYTMLGGVAENVEIHMA
ncbi:MAG: glucosamine-6-phosphate deaminase [Candidatus Atribacteria bacterium]|nr:glucosamine-6-phosphate deaminase [Candidatus Atribacteria bacterium]